MKEIRCLRVRRIWADGRHNAFTSLAELNGNIYLAFRSASDHKAMDGSIRILCSSDEGETWKSAALITKADWDLRDPKLVELHGELHLFSFGRTENGGFASYHAVSKDGMTFGSLSQLPDMGLIWGIAEFGSHIYGTDYYKVSDLEFRPRLYRSANGENWEKLLDFPMPGTEVSLDFDAEGRLYAFIRDSAYGCGSIPSVVRLEPPYTAMPVLDGKTMDLVKALNLRMAGPMIKRLKDASLLVGRCWDGGSCGDHHRNTRTDVYILEDKEEPKFCFTLPSGGDTSYASWCGIAPGRAILSYYSSHEHRMAYPLDDRSGKVAAHNTAADIYLADISHNYL